MIKLVSIELTQRCQKGCPWCYASAVPEGRTFWQPDVLLSFVKDLHANGVEAVSFGGGEPLEYPWILSFLDNLLDVPIFVSMTTSGLLLDDRVMRLLSTRVDKVHVSIHFPENVQEVTRVTKQVQALSALGMKSGINFVVKGKHPDLEETAVRLIKDAGIGSDRVIFLPLRGVGIPMDPKPVQRLGKILGAKWQSTWCLLECKESARFVSVDWEGKVGYCSYTSAKTKMEEFTYAGLKRALASKELVFCGAPTKVQDPAPVEVPAGL